MNYGTTTPACFTILPNQFASESWIHVTKTTGSSTPVYVKVLDTSIASTYNCGMSMASTVSLFTMQCASGGDKWVVEAQFGAILQLSNIAILVSAAGGTSGCSSVESAQFSPATANLMYDVTVGQ